MKRSTNIAVGLCAIAGVGGFVPSASAVTVSPVLVELSRNRPVVSIAVTNDEDQELVFQVQALAWSQQDGKDHTEETADLVVAPVIVRIAAHTKQQIRVRDRGRTDSTERSYRLVLENISSEVKPKEDAPAGIAFRISHDLPVFAAPATPGKSAAVWGRCDAPAGKTCLRLDNRGNKRIRLSGVRFVSASGETPLKIVDTVLAGAWKQWTFDSSPEALGATQLKYNTEQGEASAALPG